jgi:hypothetical protein
MQDKRVAKWLPVIVEDLIELNWDSPELLKKENHNLLYRLHFISSLDKQSFSFYLWLDKPLQLYDLFDWYFVRVKLSYSNFWVSRISHDFENGRFYTSVNLISGFPNKYLDMQIDRAIFEGKLSFFELLDLSYNEIEERLNKIYRR